MAPHPGFDGEVAIVTGAGSGIGRSICFALARAGARVVASDVDHDRAVETASGITSGGGQARAIRADVTRFEEMEALVAHAVAAYGRVDLFINNAGTGVNGEFQDMTVENWRSVLDVNLMGTVNGCRAVYSVMMRQQSGRIVNVASVAGLVPGGLMTSYAAAKHAVVGFTLSLRSEARQYGIVVSVLCPGFLETAIHDAAPNVSSWMPSPAESRADRRSLFPEPDDCVEAMLRGVRRGKPVIVIPRLHGAIWWIYRLWPGAVPRFWSRVIRAMKRRAAERAHGDDR